MSNTHKLIHSGPSHILGNYDRTRYAKNLAISRLFVFVPQFGKVTFRILQSTRLYGRLDAIQRAMYRILRPFLRVIPDSEQANCNIEPCARDVWVLPHNRPVLSRVHALVST